MARAMRLNRPTPMPVTATFDEFLLFIKLDEAQYLSVLRTVAKRDAVYMKRGLLDISMNTSSRQGARIWGDNCDMQFVLNAHGAAAYLTAYVTKDDNALSKLMQAITQHARTNQKTVVSTLREMGATILRETEMPAQLAVDIVGGIPLYHDSREYVYVNTAHPGERARLLKKPCDAVGLDSDSTDVYYANLNTKYDQRSAALAHVCLADFACEWTFDKTKGEYHEKQGHRRILQCRGYSEARDPVDYYREQVLLYMPFRTEEDLLQGKPAWKDLYGANMHAIAKARSKYVCAGPTEDDITAINLEREDMYGAPTVESGDADADDEAKSTMLKISRTQASAAMSILSVQSGCPRNRAQCRRAVRNCSCAEQGRALCQHSPDESIAASDIRLCQAPQGAARL